MIVHIDIRYSFQQRMTSIKQKWSSGKLCGWRTNSLGDLSFKSYKFEDICLFWFADSLAHRGPYVYNQAETGKRLTPASTKIVVTLDDSCTSTHWKPGPYVKSVFFSIPCYMYISSTTLSFYATRLTCIVTWVVYYAIYEASCRRIIYNNIFFVYIKNRTCRIVLVRIWRPFYLYNC